MSNDDYIWTVSVDDEQRAAFRTAERAATYIAKIANLTRIPALTYSGTVSINHILGTKYTVTKLYTR